MAFPSVWRRAASTHLQTVPLPCIRTQTALPPPPSSTMMTQTYYKFHSQSLLFMGQATSTGWLHSTWESSVFASLSHAYFLPIHHYHQFCFRLHKLCTYSFIFLVLFEIPSDTKSTGCKRKRKKNESFSNSVSLVLLGSLDFHLRLSEARPRLFLIKYSRISYVLFRCIQQVKSFCISWIIWFVFAINRRHQEYPTIASM